MKNDWYRIDNVDTIDTPALLVYPDRVSENIGVLKKFVPEVGRLRPHIKTNKSPDVARMLMDAGITKFKCATIAEAEMLAQCNASDILLAYQPVGPKADRLLALIKKYPASLFSCLIDNEALARELSEKAQAHNTKLNVFIDLNVGMNRTGIIPENAFALFEITNSLPGINVVGLHAYDGHLRDPDVAVRKQQCDEGFSRAERLQAAIENRFEKKLIMIAGGSPSFSIHSKRDHVECSPGTFIYWDWGYSEKLKEQPFVWAALVLTRIVSKTDDNTITVDLGHKAIASENPLTNRVLFLNAPDLVAIGHSEEHLVLRAPANNNYKVGDVLYGVPYHVCPTVALHDKAVVVKNHVANDTWPTVARNRKVTV